MKKNLFQLTSRSTIQVEYELYVSSITPQIGSIRGGTLVEINGVGFSEDCTKNEVTFGPVKCDLVECSYSLLKCKTANSYSATVIENSGSDPCN